VAAITAVGLAAGTGSTRRVGASAIFEPVRVGVVGCGAFGLAAAIELAARGHTVVALDRGTVPHPAASSTDVSKTLQRLYAHGEAAYVELAQRAEPVWRRWQERSGDGRFYYPIGHVVVASRWAPGERAYESAALLGLQVHDPVDARRRFPQLAIRDGDVVCFDAWGGYLASARAVAAMVALARAAGVDLREAAPVRAVEETNGGVRLALDGGALLCDRVVVAAGVWIPGLVPGAPIRATRQCMAFFEPDDAGRHRPGPLPVWAFDAPDDDCWYGHPLPDGRVKAADGPLGDSVDPDTHRDASSEFEARARAFVERRMPGLARGRLVGSRSCLYENTPDGHFLIDWAAGSGRVLIAGGGSGHGFKFGGALGPVIADALEEKENPLGRPFRVGRRFAS
jgi:glycine/D-amino acid oxidase-like deaminating enzyme